ncbi:MAG: hypothetical protein Q8O89_00290 [Nanoarchaeota archaeon]|nr:hypothetical protein [Nanoarchaeota archaeon]
MLLKNINPDNLRAFHEDFSALMKMTRGIDEAWVGGDNEFYDLFEIFKEYVQKFNEKYPGLLVEAENTMDHGFRLSIFFPNEKSLISLFDNVASKIAGLEKIGAEPDDMLKVSIENVKQVMDFVKNKLILFYERRGATSVIVELDKKKKMPELIFNKQSIENKEDPEFIICAHYALKDFKKDVDLKEIRLKFPANTLSPSIQSAGALKG